MEIITPQVFADGLTINTISSGKDAVTFMSDTIFFGRPYFTTDTAGFAKIEKGDQSVDVVFDKEYLEQPIVNATITLNTDPQLKDLNTETDADAIKALKDAQEKNIQDLFAADVKYLVVNKSEKGFTIILKEKATQDINFSWTALAVKSAKTFSSKVDTAPTPDTPPTSPTPPAETSPEPVPEPVIDETPASETLPEPDTTPVPDVPPTSETPPEPVPEPIPEPVPEVTPDDVPSDTGSPVVTPEPIPDPGL